GSRDDPGQVVHGHVSDENKLIRLLGYLLTVACWPGGAVGPNTGSIPQRDLANRRVSRCPLAESPTLRGAGPCRVTAGHDVPNRSDSSRMIALPEMGRPM